MPLQPSATCANNEIKRQTTGGSRRAATSPSCSPDEGSDFPFTRGSDWPSFLNPRGYPGIVANEGSVTGSGNTSPRHFGQLPELVISDDFDQPLPQDEAAFWDGPDLAAQNDSGAGEELDDWPVDVADLRGPLLEAESDLPAGRAVSGKDIRTRYGLPGSSAD